MKFDMHCHTKEGSIDGKLGLDTYIRILREKGFQGMLITDHNSYEAYRYYKEHIKGKKHTQFVVLKGIEYDTLNAGHVLIIMPEGVKPRILEMRGLPLRVLIRVVHHYGGILGPAHPCGEKYLSLANTKAFERDKEVMEHFDFVEIKNACESDESNAAAAKLAETYRIPGFGGSDAHRADCVGLTYTEFFEDIRTESDLIRYVKAKKKTVCGGEHYEGTTKEKIGKANDLLLYSFWVYNRSAALLKKHKRKKKLQTEMP